MTTTEERRSHRIRPLSPDVAPGLDAHARRVQRGFADPSWGASPLVGPDDVFRVAGPAWSDEALAAELRDQHRRLGAGPASLDALSALAEGSAGCVVTGQQPGLLGGPLYCAYKIAGAVALAGALSARGGSRVVPVYWCGADDSDFEEVRRIWFWSQRGAPFRGELPSRVWTEGMRVGSLRGRELEEVERGILEHAGAAPGSAALRDALFGGSAALDFGQRMAAFYLRRFDGLVVVDARSERLRALGRDLFAQYARRHAELTRGVGEHTRELSRQGRATPLTERAMETGLFAVEGDVRRKLTADDLADGLPAEDVAPSVLLRPLWQDHLLAPIAAVLGPAELAYHAQIAPLYGPLGVVAARPVARPHVTLWPKGLPWPEDETLQHRLLAGGEDGRRALARMAAVPSWTRALTRARRSVAGVMEELGSALDEAAARSLAQGTADRLAAELERLEVELEVPVLQRRARQESVWRWGPRWLAVRGVPQERALAAATGWWAWGEAFRETLDDLGRHYTHAIERGEPTTFLAQEAS